jgi:hypothetical protein
VNFMILTVSVRDILDKPSYIPAVVSIQSLFIGYEDSFFEDRDSLSLS